MRDPEYNIPDPEDELICRHCAPDDVIETAPEDALYICRGCAYEEKMERRYEAQKHGDF